MVFLAASASASISSIIWFKFLIFIEAVILDEIEKKNTSVCSLSVAYFLNIVIYKNYWRIGELIAY